jgi:hypothetical protein
LVSVKTNLVAVKHSRPFFFARILSTRDARFTVLTVGSSGEGVNLPDSDTYTMNVFPDAM